MIELDLENLAVALAGAVFSCLLAACLAGWIAAEFRCGKTLRQRGRRDAEPQKPGTRD